MISRLTSGYLAHLYSFVLIVIYRGSAIGGEGQQVKYKLLLVSIDTIIHKQTITITDLLRTAGH